MINQNVTIKQLNKLGENMITHLGIEFTDIGKDFICAKMPVDQRTVQPMGILHGGASVALAETLGSMGSVCCLNGDKQYCVGLEINANHIKSTLNGYVSGKATAIHIGKRTHIWEIKIKTEHGDLVCVSRITLAIIDRKPNCLNSNALKTNKITFDKK